MLSPFARVPQEGTQQLATLAATSTTHVPVTREPSGVCDGGLSTVEPYSSQYRVAVYGKK